MQSYDAWLEAPYQEMIRQEEAIVDAWDAHCEAHGWDYDAADENHPDHHLFQQWYLWIELVETYYDLKYTREWEEAEAAREQWEWDYVECENRMASQDDRDLNAYLQECLRGTGFSEHDSE